MYQASSFEPLVTITQKERASSMIFSLLSQFFSDKHYETAQAEIWSQRISEQVVVALQRFSPEYKYCSTCVIISKERNIENDSGVHINSTCYWNNSSDGSLVIRWEDPTMYCIINVFAIII